MPLSRTVHDFGHPDAREAYLSQTVHDLGPLFAISMDAQKAYVNPIQITRLGRFLKSSCTAGHVGCFLRL